MRQSNIPAVPSDTQVLRGAVVTGISNAVINGAIQWYLLKGRGPIPLSVDGITNDQQTVLGTAVPLAISIAMILTVVAFMTLKVPNRRFFPAGLWLTVKHGMFAFGLVVSGAVVWQRLMGSISVSTGMAVLILGVVAGVIGGVINFMTIHASLTSVEE